MSQILTAGTKAPDFTLRVMPDQNRVELFVAGRGQSRGGNGILDAPDNLSK
jgi:hypothetical protein